MPQLTHIKPNATIIDLGGTKECIIQHIPDSIRKNFVAAHPMAGTEFYGPKAALPNLFKDSIVILANLQDSGDSQVKIAREIFLGIGMKIIKMDAHEHDKHIALISHMPHVISYALANAVLKQEDPHAFFLHLMHAARAPLLQLFCDTAQPSNVGSPARRAAVTASPVQAGQVPNLLFIPESSAE